MTDNDDQQISLPLSEWAKEVARHAAIEAVEHHVNRCPMPGKVEKMERRVNRLELGYAGFIGALTGSGIVGGFIGGMVTKMM